MDDPMHAMNHEHVGMARGHHGSMVRDFRQRFWVCLVATVPILLLSEPVLVFPHLGTGLLFAGSDWVLMALSAFVYWYGGTPFLRGSVQELSARKPGMMSLVAMAISIAFFYSIAVSLGLTGMSFYWELATLIDIMLLGHWVEMSSLMAASHALENLASLLPSTADVFMPDGTLMDHPVGHLRAGDRILVRPGEKIPADGSVEQGRSGVNEALLTGESKSVAKTAGDRVIGGSVNEDGALTIIVQKVGEETYLAQVVSLVRQAQDARSRTQDLADRAAMWLTVVALGAGVLTMGAWLALGKGLAFALERTVTVMVTACPHALGLAIPLVVARSTGLLAQRGLLLRDRTAFESARSVNAVIFDKTGALTTGMLSVQNVVASEESFTTAQVLRLAASVEIQSEHPIARAIVDAARLHSPDVDQADAFEALPGIGAKAEVGGHTVQVVRPGYLREHDLPWPVVLKNREADEKGKTVAVVLQDNAVVGAILLSDTVRLESRQAIAALRAMSIKTVMLTGDSKTSASAVATELGLDEVVAEVMPGDKAARVRDIQDEGLVVAMVGDGINDAPALAQAYIGIAIGTGTDIAIETADVILVRDDPRDVVTLILVARKTYRKMIENLVWALAYNVVAIPLAAGVLAGAGFVMNPAVGAVLMSLSTVIVAANAQSLRGS
ncbi:MAG TPA: copper-translocating P-type ATPase [Candidatus Cryosericum sp.]|nr:copper-translocating P-type ATPase [Candidatus Cryosericum sp.]